MQSELHSQYITRKDLYFSQTFRNLVGEEVLQKSNDATDAIKAAIYASRREVGKAGKSRRMRRILPR